ncbi:MAG: 30S ribosomal protein S16 [Candidatus Saccharimonadales bacterium]
MLTIRLTRKGKKNQPFFRVVVIDKRRSPKGGRAVEVVGYVDPLTKRRSLEKDRILHWIKNGAQPSGTVHNLLVSEKIIDAKKIHVARVKKSAEAVAVAATPAATVEKPAETSAESVAPTPPVETPKEESKPEEKKE